VEKVKCLKCGRVGYTASPEEAPCAQCGTSYKDMHLSYRVSIASASTYTSSNGAFKMKINVMVKILLEDKVLFFVNNLTFYSLNQVENFDYMDFWKHSMLVGTTEPTLNVALANLLRQRELMALGEAIIHRTTKGVGKKPDVLITINGIKVILEGKFEASGIETVLEKQCIERIDDGLCEICIGVIYTSRNI